MRIGLSLALRILFSVFCFFIMAFLVFQFRYDALSVYRDLKRELHSLAFLLVTQSMQCPQDPIVIVALGQSNAGNHLATPYALVDGTRAYSFYRGRCFRLADPVPGATGQLGSLWSLLGDRLTKQMNKPVVVIVQAHAASSVKEWSEGPPWFARRAADAVQQALAAGLVPDAAIWVQGERDAMLGTSLVDYKRRLGGIVKLLNTAVSGKHIARERQMSWIIALVSRCGIGGKPSERIRSAQRAVAQNIGSREPGPDLDSLGEEFRTDGCHFNEAGRRKVVEMLIRSLSLHLVDRR